MIIRLMLPLVGLFLVIGTAWASPCRARGPLFHYMN
jgi:hypothetical protein